MKKIKFNIISLIFCLIFNQINSQSNENYSRWDIKLSVLNNAFNNRYIRSIDDELISVTQNKVYNYAFEINYMFPQKKIIQYGIGISYNQYNKSLSALYKNSPYKSDPNLPNIYYNFLIQNNIRNQTIGLNFLLEKSFSNSFFIDFCLNVEFPISQSLENNNNFNFSNIKVNEIFSENSMQFYNFIIPELNISKYISKNIAVFGGIKFSFWNFNNKYELNILKNNIEILNYQIDSRMSSLELGLKYSFQIN